jgi:hypothetical protein
MRIDDRTAGIGLHAMGIGIRRVTLAGLAALGIAACAPSPALAVPLPSATTEGVSEVTFDAATLSGTVDPGGGEAASDTRWCFQYGSGANPGYNLGSLPLLSGDAGRGTSGVPVSVQLTDLAPGDTYRYRLVAVNSLGMGLGSTACSTEGGQETEGAEEIFTTPITLPAPLAVTGVPSGVSQNAATISGTVNPQGYRTSYEFQVGVDTSYGVQVFGEAGEGSESQQVSLTLPYLQPGTSYHYRLVAISRGGTSYGADAMFTTPVFPTATLSAPTAPLLVATPTVTFPSVPIKATKAKPKQKTKTTKARRASKGAGKASRRHSNERKGRR